jgi:hypothetical protein
LSGEASPPLKLRGAGRKTPGADPPSPRLSPRFSGLWRTRRRTGSRLTAKAKERLGGFATTPRGYRSPGREESRSGGYLRRGRQSPGRRFLMPRPTCASQLWAEGPPNRLDALIWWLWWLRKLARQGRTTGPGPVGEARWRSQVSALGG